ncbi:MAG: hypothetical protein HPY53_15490 [Brevinematales bacterium]|nr:hypothetical protein [Brevinematales bacterium]
MITEPAIEFYPAQDNASAIPISRTLIVLVSRTLGFLLFQSAVAGVLLIAGADNPLDQSVAWWPYSAAFGSIVSYILMIAAMRKENKSVMSFYKFNKPTILIDILTVVGAFVVMGPLTFFPNILLGNLLFGDSALTMNMLFRPFPPTLAVIGAIIFPLTVGLSEIPVYYGYTLPRLKGRIGLTGALILSVTFHALQHSALPFIPDWRFIVWRFGMFLPLALAMGILVYSRPRLMPYVVICHILMDLSAGYLIYHGAVKGLM